MTGRNTHAPRSLDPYGPGAVALDLWFDLDRLPVVRAAVAAHGARWGAPRDRVAHLVIIASELASNAIRHGGGHGRLRMWRADDAVHCAVSDEGTGLADPDTAGTVVPPVLSASGRGLWIVRQLAASMHVHTTVRGTTVTAVLPLTAA